MATNYLADFNAFYQDKFRVEGAFGPVPVIPPFLAEWLGLAFPMPSGDPAARNVMDLRTKKEGKSALAACVALYMASRKTYSEVVIASSDQDQSRDRVLRACKFGIENGPLVSHAKVYRDVIELDNHSLITAIPYDFRGVAGGNYSCVIFDELHAWTFEGYRRMFDELIIPPTQPDGVRWIASYAGFEGESTLLKEWWTKALSGELLKDKTNLPIRYNSEVNLLAFVDVGPESWRMPWMTEQYINEVRASERPNSFRRLWLNEWVTSESQFLPEGAWQACKSKDIHPLTAGERSRLIVGADASTSRDYTSLIGTEYNQGLNTVDVRLVKVWKPKKGFLRGGKPTIDLDETIGAEVIRLFNEGLLDAVVADPFQLHSLIVQWEKLGIKVLELPQTTGRIEADQGLYDAIVSQGIRHYGDHELDTAIGNAIAVETPRGMRIAKEKTSMKIDAAVALSMSVYGAFKFQKSIQSFSILEDGAFKAWINDEEYIAPSTIPHKPGVTWRNCRRRNSGCQACIDELTAEGYFDELEKERERYRTFEEPDADELKARRAWIGKPFQSPPDQRELIAQAAVQVFWKSVKDNLKGQTK